ncbi:MAG: DinB family protein [Lewinellaceae bacterium]|nr:DinB family protein [Saprospiraceae bacterium]MCB9313025.1 DinB family protein [Lewinellaceae bacterium]HRW75572.1 DinB family protein [Saprospiraceae bacterium]
MSSSFPILAREQYALVCNAREVLLAYCDRLPPEALLTGQPEVGWGGSIRNLLVHNANAYRYWIGMQALGRSLEFIHEADVPDLSAVRDLYRDVDRMMEAFLEAYGEEGQSEVEVHRKGRTYSVDALAVFTHVITHEFHHKGQILTLGRRLGHIPVDTDILRDTDPDQDNP